MILPLSIFILQKKEMILESLILQGLQSKNNLIKARKSPSRLLHWDKEKKATDPAYAKRKKENSRRHYYKINAEKIAKRG